MSVIESITQFATMVTVVLAAGGAVWGLIAERGFRKQRNQLEQRKLELEIQRLSKELGYSTEAPSLEAHQSSAQEISDTQETQKTTALSVGARIGYIVLAMLSSTTCVLFIIVGLVSASDDELNLGHPLIHFVLAGLLGAITANLVKIYKR